MGANWLTLFAGIDAFYNIGVGQKGEAKVVAQEWPHVACFGCEPNKKQYEKAVEWFPGQILPYGISTERFHTLFEANRGNFTFYPIPRAKQDSVIECVTLDFFDFKADKPHNIFLWMDIEGHELEALRSGPELLASRRVKYMNLEVRGQPPAPGWASERDINAFLLKNGYEEHFVRRKYSTHKDVVYKLRD